MILALVATLLTTFMYAFSGTGSAAGGGGVALVADPPTDINPDSSDLDPVDADGASGGRVNGLASVEADNDVFYAATEYGGIYKSTDGGLTWSYLETHLPTVTWDVEVDPVSTDTVYGTSRFDGRIVGTRSGIEVSYDGGATWTFPPTSYPNPALEGTPDDNTPVASFTCNIAADRTEPDAFGIAIRPDAPENVFVGTACGIARSSDSGATWEHRDPSEGGIGAKAVYDVVVQPASVAFPNGIVDICSDEGHFRSTDGGIGYTASAGALPVGRCSIAVSPDESWVLFVAASDNNLYESDDAGGSWTNLGQADPVKGPQGRRPFVVTNQRSNLFVIIDKFDVWTGDVSLFRISCSTPIFPIFGGPPRCPAGGNPLPAGWNGPFTRCRDPDGNGCAHDDVGDIVFDTEAASDACPMVFSSDGGVYYNTDVGADCQDPDWEQPTVTPHALWVFGMAGVDLPGDDDEALYIGLQDNGVMGTLDAGSASPSWHNERCCDGFDLAADEDRVVYTRGAFGGRGFRLFHAGPGMVGETVFEEVPDGADDDGDGVIDEFDYPPTGLLTAFQFGESIDIWGDAKYVILTNNCANLAAFTNGIDDDLDGNVDEYDEGNGCPIVAPSTTGSDGGVYITEDIAATDVDWVELGHPTEPPSNGFGEVQVSFDGATPVFYVQAGGGDRRSTASLWKFVGTDPAGSWTRVDNNDGLSGGFNVFAVDPNDADRLYASNLAGTGPRIVYSTDGGLTWDVDAVLTDLIDGGGAFKNQVLSPQAGMLAFDPEDPDILVAGGLDSGVFLSDDGGRHWRLLTDPDTPHLSGIPHLPRPYFVHFDHEPADELTLYVATRGRGVWRLNLLSLDAEVLGVEVVDPPAEILLGDPAAITVRAEVVNHGPAGPADFDLTFAADAPSGCAMVGGDSVGTTVNLAVGVITEVEALFTIECSEPSHHIFDFTVDITPADRDVFDTDSANNDGATSMDVEVVVPVVINIRPGASPNPINTRSNGVVSVAILTTSAGEYGTPYGFDATSIDALSVRFGRCDDVWAETGGAFEAHGQGHPEDSWELDEVTMDGDLDLVLHFRIQETGILAGDTEACVKGEWVDAFGAIHKFFGRDAILTVPP